MQRQAILLDRDPQVFRCRLNRFRAEPLESLSQVLGSQRLLQKTFHVYATSSAQ